MYDNNSVTSPNKSRFYTPSEDMVELLQSILEDNSGNSVSIDEAREIGIQLVSLYECLARERSPSVEMSGNEQS